LEIPPHVDFDGTVFSMVEIENDRPPDAILIAGHLYRYECDVPALSERNKL